MRKVALVTGVARGIGKAIVERFIKEGFVVHGTYFSSKEKAMELQKKYGSDNLIIHGAYDFRILSQIQALIKELSAFRFDAIISNAGMFSENDDFIDFNIDIFNEIMHCNLYAPLMICMGLQKNINANGSIVIVSSNDAYYGAYSSISYSTSKAALISLTKSLAVNFGKKRIKVNSVSPGAIDTDMNTAENMNIAPLFTPLCSIGTPNDVAKVAYFLANDESDFISGENITIDGGYNIVSILLKEEAENCRGV